MTPLSALSGTALINTWLVRQNWSPVLKDFEECARAASMKRGRAEAIIEEVGNVVACWRDYVDYAGVFPEHRDRIADALRSDEF